MLDKHEVLIAKSVDGEQVSFEVNWSDDPDIAQCRMFRVTVGEKTLQIPYSELYQVIMFCGKPAEQKKMVPLKLKNVKRVERRLHFRVKVSKDLRAGDVIEVVAPWIDEVPTEQEILAGNLNNRGTKIHTPNV